MASEKTGKVIDLGEPLIEQGYKLLRLENGQLYSSGLPQTLRLRYPIGEEVLRPAGEGWGALAVFTNAADARKCRDTFGYLGYDFDLYIYRCLYAAAEDHWYGLPKEKNPAWQKDSITGKWFWDGMRWLGASADGRMLPYAMKRGSGYADIIVVEPGIVE